MAKEMAWGDVVKRFFPPHPPSNKKQEEEKEFLGKLIYIRRS